MACGIYCINNNTNNKKYIGQATNSISRWKSHINKLNSDKHVNKHLQSAWNKDGEENFSFSILEECDEQSLITKEQFWIDFYKTTDRNFGYNKRDAGSKGKLSDETKNKIGQANKGRHQTKESIEKRASKLRGISRSKESVEKSRLSNIGKKRSEESIMRMSGKTGDKSVWFGKKLPKETVEKMIISRTGQKRTEETKQKMSMSQKDSKNIRSSSIYYGVRFLKQQKKWQVSIQINKKNIHIGLFDNEDDAARAYDKYIIENNLDRKLNFQN